MRKRYVPIGSKGAFPSATYPAVAMLLVILALVGAQTYLARPARQAFPQLANANASMNAESAQLGLQNSDYSRLETSAPGDTPAKGRDGRPSERIQTSHANSATYADGPLSSVTASFTVNNTADTVDANPGNGVCADASGNCTLRAAIMETNALAGADTITVQAGTYTLTRVGSDDTAINGDLDVTGPLTINGSGSGNTIIQAGTTNANGIDKIFSFNPLGVGSGFAVSISNLTLRFGKNPETFGNGNGFGGCFDFDSGTSGVGSFAMSNVIVTDCQTTQADGGGGAIFLTSGSGTISISNTTIQNNIAHRPSPNFAIGGGLFFGCAGAVARPSL